METKQTLEERITEWRTYISRRKAVKPIDIEELEDHLRTQVEALGKAGLDEDEAFLVAVKRLGDLDSLSRKFAREYSERLWKQLIVLPDVSESSSNMKREAMVAIALAIAAAVTFQFARLFDMSSSFYRLNFSLFVLPFLAMYFAWKRSLDRAGRIWLAAAFFIAALAVNILPFKQEGHTELLAVLHLPIALWLAVGIAYICGRWNDHDQRMNFVRFSGEWVIYYTLIALGGGVLMIINQLIFNAIGVDVGSLLEGWVIPSGALGAVIIGAWLVEAKQSVIENIAPVLTRLFTPLFTVSLLAFLVTMIWTGSGINVEREVLIGFDLLLVLVLGLLLYSISARDHQAPPNLFDKLLLLLVICALLVNTFALWAIEARISEWGFSPNKVAALGENIILLVNLGWSAVLYTRFLTARASFAPLERWQTAYLPVYAVWAWIVVVVFPIIFNYQ
ncbi:permease prefix domain 1-containing protein [Acidobacteriota bacterium]